MRHHSANTLLILLATLLAGCAPTYAPVIDKYGADNNRAPVTRGVHVVRAGETLYSIAWRYGWDFKALASANGVSAPYTIYPGQQIRLDRRVAASRPATTSTPVTAPAPSRPAATSTTRSAPAATTSSAAKPATRSTPVAAAGALRWQWPAAGKVIQNFSSSAVGRSGIVIDGHDGDPVRAAADGVVVYRGDGLTGYGNLLIIKHNERWLSAYAHNKSMLVKEGQQVKAGEQIAHMGASGTFRTQLHFEVRRDGTPIDPLTVLPGK